MSETKEERAARLEIMGIESNEMINKQFLADKNLSECIRNVQILFDRWNLRPLERDIVIMMLKKYEGDRKMAKKSKGMFDGLLNETMDKIGGLGK